LNISKTNILKDSIKSVLSDWNRNYKHHGGLSSITKCILGTLFYFSKTKKHPRKKIEILTFSVIPGLTYFWFKCMSSLKNFKNISITIGDCSGGLKIKNKDINLNLYPIINLEHGYKLDLFFSKVCNADYIVVSDDDIFFQTSEPLEWAINQFNENNNLGVVSLYPRKNKASWLENLDFVMGSYCLVIRTEIWLKERLSFQQVKPANWRKIGDFFDTADFANHLLIEKGYDVVCLPQTLQNKLVSFTSLSLWGLRIQQTRGYINKAIRARPNEYEKAYRTAITLSELNNLFLDNQIKYNTVKQKFLERTIKITKSKIDKYLLNEISLDVKNQINNIRKINFIL
tara:strand:+ start:478 stop:1506 length:1029 start_codon:yes stop_codon:yes gene_type:complete